MKYIFFLKLFLYHAANGILFPCLGIETALPTVKVWSHNYWTPREVPEIHFFPWILHHAFQFKFITLRRLVITLRNIIFSLPHQAKKTKNKNKNSVTSCTNIIFSFFNHTVHIQLCLNYSINIAKTYWLLKIFWGYFF